MRTRATIFLGIAAMLLLAASAQADTVGKVSLLWAQGGESDTVYEQADAPTRDLRVQVWHDRDDDQAYRRGQELSVHFETDRDLYVVVYRIDVDGEVEILWPTSRYDDGFVYGLHTYTLPRPGSPVRLRVGERRGVEYIQALASEYPFDLRDLGIDFAFDLDARDSYRYAIEGDPFLAVNDVNFAITGLEEDVDYIVTDWSHLYVESKVDYPRYTCTQCHGDNGHEVHPYVDTCTTVNVYNDWGWHRRWYTSFGWYPLYYEPPFYYWDIGYSRPYWYAYYPVYYRWPSYGVYSRPYSVWWWYDSPHYRGDFRLDFAAGRTRTRPLYDLDGPGGRRLVRDSEGRTRYTLPTSARRHVKGKDVDRTRLVREAAPRRERTDLAATRGDRSTRNVNRGVDRRGSVRTDVVRRDEDRIRSLVPRDRAVDRDRGGERRGSGEVRNGDNRERRWTRPVVRNERDDRRPSNDRPSVRPDDERRRTNRDRDAGDVRRTTPRREVKPERQRATPRREVKPERQRTTPRREVKPERQRTTPRREVKPERQRATPRREVKPERQRATPRRDVKPAPRQTAPRREVRPAPRSTPKPPSKAQSSGGSRSKSGSGKSRSRGGRG